MPLKLVRVDELGAGDSIETMTGFAVVFKLAMVIVLVCVYGWP